ncbi:MAG TPA: hypothetical protein VGM81_25360 [Burkholderiaceae bacterium]|jgi:parvulin-like peptidyl-prolyl isomerase
MQVRSIAQVLAVVALSLVAASAYAAPQEIVKLPRVVIVGKAQAVQAAQVAQIEKLPRVVVVGYSQATLAQRELLAANNANNAKSSAKTVRVASL